MNFIYGIMCHQLTNPLVYLVNELIKSPNSKILIHVDKKSDLDHIKKSLPSSSQIEFLKERVDVHWGGYTQIEATLKLLNYASQFEYKYFSLLSGDDIPLMSIESIEKYLLSSDQEYIGYELQADPKNRIKYLYPDFFFIKEKSILEKIKCKLIIFLHKLGLYTQNIEGLPKLYKGSLWFILSYQAVQYILDFIKTNKDYDLAFRKSLCADEVYFHTIIQNSYFQERIYHPEDEEQVSEGGLRYIDWMSGPDYPKILDESDFDKMKQSGMLFARKVKANIDIDLLKQYFQYS